MSSFNFNTRQHSSRPLFPGDYYDQPLTQQLQLIQAIEDAWSASIMKSLKLPLQDGQITYEEELGDYLFQHLVGGAEIYLLQILMGLMTSNHSPTLIP